MGKTKKEARSSSSTALTLQSLQSHIASLSSQRPPIEFTSHSVRIGSLVWDTQTFLRNIKHNFTYAFTFLLLMEKIQAYGPPSVKVDFYTSDPTGATNYRYVSYSREKELKDVPDDIIHNCHPNMTSVITTAAFSTIKTVGDISAFIARGINQTAQADFERCIIEQMQNAYDDAEAASELFLSIFLPSFFGGIPVVACLLICLGMACFGAYAGCRLGAKKLHKNEPELATSNFETSENEIKLDTIADIDNSEESLQKNADLEANTTEAEKDEAELEKDNPGEKEEAAVNEEENYRPTYGRGIRK